MQSTTKSTCFICSIKMTIILCFIVLYLFVQESFAAKILVIPGHNAASHTKSLYPFAEAMAARDKNEVYMLQILQGNQQKAKGNKVRDIYLMLPEKEATFASNTMMWTTLVTEPILFLRSWYVTIEPCTLLLHDPQLRDEFLKIVKQKWDVIISGSYFAACGMLATQLNGAPWIDFSTSFVLPYAANIRGTYWNPAYMPAFRPKGTFESDNFWHRFWNTYDIYTQLLVFKTLEYFIPRWIDSPLSMNFSAYKFYSQSALTFGSVPYELNYPHPKSFSVVELDFACTIPNELPEKFASFVEDPDSKGTILFAMGHFVDWASAPPRVVQSFVDAFNELSEYRIIWQYVSKGAKPKVGKNVMLDSWIPQTGILHHNKTLLFVSHVGFKSFRESICAIVPIVAMPMFAEQLRHTTWAKERGFAVFLDKMNISKDVLLSFKQILDDPSYKKSVQKVSGFVNDRITDPIDLGIFWLDFVLKHRDYASEHLRINAPPTFFPEYSSFLAILIICFIFVLILF